MRRYPVKSQSALHMFSQHSSLASKIITREALDVVTLLEYNIIKNYNIIYIIYNIIKNTLQFRRAIYLINTKINL